MKQFGLFLLALLACTFSAHAADYEKEFKKHGFVDVQELDSTILVELKYSTTDNFMGINMYGKKKKAYFRPEIAKKVAEKKAAAVATEEAPAEEASAEETPVEE